MSLNATFDSVVSRVRLAGTALDDAGTALFERSKNGLKWYPVRGGMEVPVSVSDTANLDDYEFVPGAVNHYRVTAGSDVFTTTITPDQTGVWLKSIARPFLNRKVNVESHKDINRPARNGVFDIIGRSDPVGVTDVRSSRRWEMTLWVDTVAEAESLELVFTSGDPLFIQANSTADIPAGYVLVGDLTIRRWGTISTRRWFDLSLTNVAPPGPDVVGYTSTWESLVAEFGTWADVLAFFPTWADILEYVSSPDTVYVP
jgi:hypothetical protein